MKGLIPYVLAIIAIAGVAVAQQSPTEEPPAPPDCSQTETTPLRLTITVSIADPEDLKVQQGDRLTSGQLIADRTRERGRLEAQHNQLSLALQRLQTSTISAPLPPAAAPSILEPTYLEEEAAIARAQATVDQAEAAIAAKQQELTYLAELENLDPLVLEHEQANLAELQQAHTAAVRDYQLALGRRSSSEYDHSVVSAQAVSTRNRDALEYQQQQAAYEQRLRDRDYQVAQTQLRLDEVNNAIASLAVVRAPYAGRVRQVKWLGQNPDGSISVELSVLVRAGKGSQSALPGEQPSVSSGADGVGDR